jgi:hypothetical protein
MADETFAAQAGAPDTTARKAAPAKVAAVIDSIVGARIELSRHGPGTLVQDHQLNYCAQIAAPARRAARAISFNPHWKVTAW